MAPEPADFAAAIATPCSDCANRKGSRVRDLSAGMEEQQRVAKQPRLSESTVAATRTPSAAQQSYEVREAAQRRRVGRPEGWSESQRCRPYLPVGALVSPARQVQTVRTALQKLDWLKHLQRNIHACVPARHHHVLLPVSLRSSEAGVYCLAQVLRPSVLRRADRSRATRRDGAPKHVLPPHSFTHRIQ